MFGDRSNYIRCIQLLSFCYSFLVFTSPAKAQQRDWTWRGNLAVPHAQIIPDNSLGQENSIVTPNVTREEAIADLIEGGVIRDNNLFHSFSEFNIKSGDKVYFANPDGIDNILTRVTGNNISEIFGTLGVDGAANLFLLNPNGIVFGENAALDLNGSFLATTAGSYIFDNGLKYSAINPDAPPLLTVNMPVGLQIGTPGKILVNGVGHRIMRENDVVPYINLDGDRGLRTKPGKSLALIGGEITLNGGTITVPEGNIELGSVLEGTVKIDFTEGWNFDYQNIEVFEDINLLQQGLVDVSGTSSGSINLHGANITLKDGSIINSVNQVLPSKGKITVEATQSLLLQGTTPDGITRGGITSQNLGAEDSAPIEIKAKDLTITNSGFIGTVSYGNGKSGDVDVRVSDSLSVIGLAAVNRNLTSALNTGSFAKGNSGDLTVNAGQIAIEDGGIVISGSFDSGDAGNIKISAAEFIRVEGTDKNLIPSSLSSTSFRDGNAGNLNVNTPKLIVRDGGTVNTATFARGNAGNIEINASKSVLVSNTAWDLVNPSFIGSSANILDPISRQFFGLPPAPMGDAGSLTINTPNLRVMDRGQITVRNDGSGNAGNLNLNSNNISIENAGITASTELGNGGNIYLQVDDILLLQDNGFISARARETGDGGNISIDADAIAILKTSQLNSSAFQGQGGNIDVTTQGLFVSPDSKISASSRFGLDGTVNVETINGDRPIELTRLPENLINTTQQVTAGCSVGNNQFAIAGSGGLPENPAQYLRGQTIWQDLRIDTPVGEFSDFNMVLEPSVIEAQSWKINSRGNIELVAINNGSIWQPIPKNCHDDGYLLQE